MSNEIQLYSKLQNPIEAITQIGRMFAKSGMFGCEREEQGQVLAMICLAEHKSPVAITRDYDIVEGKLRKKALAALADFRAIGGKHVWKSSGDAPAVKEDDRYAEIQLTDREGNTISYRYSIADAKLEGLIKPRSRWEKRPGNMLRARCISNGLGMICPELYAGGDGDSESEPRESAPLNMQPAPATTTAAEPKPANVIEIKTSPPGDAKAEAAMGLAPEAKAVTVEVVAAPALAAAQPAAGTLPPDLLAQVESAIGAENRTSAMIFLAAQKWITEDQNFSHLSEGRARQIIKKREDFLKAVKGGAK